MVERGELERGVAALRRWKVNPGTIPGKPIAGTPRCWLLVVILLFVCSGAWATASAAGPFLIASTGEELEWIGVDTLTGVPDTLHALENKRWVAAALAVFLGPFGAHRLYLGTTTKVPIIYGITFGGFGVLALIDLGHILFTKDLSRYEGDGRVFMWARPKAAITPP